jgi:Zn-dependent protease with chaperone function
VTSADVTVYPGPTTHDNETLYLSLPLMRILSREELTAVIGHELGHFRGQDTKFSLKFYPIYSGTTQALAAIQTREDEGASSLALLPAFAILSFFLEEFAKAERTIGRDRELEADRAGASVSSARAIATSLLKIGAFVPLWSDVRSAMVNALGEGKSFTNVSTLYAEAAASAAKPELLDDIAKQATSHPTDTHPPTIARLEALGLSVETVRAEALRIDSSQSSAHVLERLEELEQVLTDVEQRVLLELGYAKLPETSAQTNKSDD